MTFCAPRTLVLMHSKGLYSAVGTCLSAAVCTTMSIPSIARRSRSASRVSLIKKADRGVLGGGKQLRHFKLFELIARKNDEPFDRRKPRENGFDEGLAKGAGAAREQDTRLRRENGCGKAAFMAQRLSEAPARWRARAHGPIPVRASGRRREFSRGGYGAGPQARRNVREVWRRPARSMRENCRHDRRRVRAWSKRVSKSRAPDFYPIRMSLEQCD